MKPNISSVKTDNCSGCSLCSAVCPKQAIHIEKNEEGFFYPVINSKICINCGFCYEKCPFVHILNNNNETAPEIWACWHNDDRVVKASSSGGGFTVLADFILERNGIVYGASLDSDLEVRHRRVTSKEQLFYLRGSKYIQSHTESVYQKLREDIKTNKDVLFSGTPCQIAGVYSFLGEVPANLYTCDLVCHGVNSSLVFGAYITYMSQKLGQMIKSVSFREKDTSWADFSMKLIYDGGHKNIPVIKDPFFSGFYKNYYLRLSCYNCHYARLPRIADITIGDFWHCGNENKPEYYNAGGTSLVLINNKKGKKLFSESKHNIVGAVADLNKAILCNFNISHHTNYPRDWYIRNQVFDLIKKGELNILFESLLKPRRNFLEKLKYFVLNPDKLFLKLSIFFKSYKSTVITKGRI